MNNPTAADHAAWIEGIIRDFRASEANTLAGEKVWDGPLVAIARGDDQLFAQLKATSVPSSGHRQRPSPSPSPPRHFPPTDYRS